MQCLPRGSLECRHKLQAKWFTGLSWILQRFCQSCKSPIVQRLISFSLLDKTCIMPTWKIILWVYWQLRGRWVLFLLVTFELMREIKWDNSIGRLRVGHLSRGQDLLQTFVHSGRVFGHELYIRNTRGPRGLWGKIMTMSIRGLNWNSCFNFSWLLIADNSYELNRTLFC